MLVCMFACTPKNKMLEKDESIVIRIYGMYCDGPIFHYQYLKDCDEAYALIELLNNAKKTGETAMKISDDVIDESKIRDYPVELGTSWIEIADRIYRISHDDTQIWLVSSHFGEGEELEMTDEIRQAVKDAWFYSPYRMYRGTYTIGDETVELEVKNEGNSPISMSIKSINMRKEPPFVNRVTVEVTATEDMDTTVYLKFKKIIGDETEYEYRDGRAISLKKDVPQAVELEYYDPPRFHSIRIETEMTIADIQLVEPSDASES